MPQLHKNAFPVLCLGMMAAIVVCQVYLFHRLGWLRSILRSLDDVRADRKPAK